MAKGVQDWIDSSLLIKTFVGDTIGPNKWHSDRAGSGWGGTFIDVGTHILDLMLWLAEAPAVDVSAIHQQTDVDWASLVNAQGKFANGITFSLTFSDQLRGGDFDFNGQGRVTIYGDRGYLTADWLGFMTTEAEEIWIESRGVRQKIEPSEAHHHPGGRICGLHFRRGT